MLGTSLHATPNAGTVEAVVIDEQHLFSCQARSGSAHWFLVYGLEGYPDRSTDFNT
jgi:hypothetical protein